MNVTELRRLLSLLVGRPALDVVLGPPMPEVGFPAQVWRARSIGARRRCAAVVWFRVISPSGPRGEEEIFLHLVDRLTNKALIKTLRLRGRAGLDMHQQVALKLWALLRASLLELQGTPGARAPEVAQILGPSRAPWPRGGSAAAPSRPLLGQRRAGLEPPLRLGLSYLVGVFASGQVWHHGVGLGADVSLWRSRRSALALSMGATVELLWPVEERLAGVSIRLELVPSYLSLGLRWYRSSFVLEGRLRAGALIQKAAVTGPSDLAMSGRDYWRGNPLLGGLLAGGWMPGGRILVELFVAADGLLRGQCFDTAPTRSLCVDRARFTMGLQLRLALP